MFKRSITNSPVVGSYKNYFTIGRIFGFYRICYHTLICILYSLTQFFYKYYRGHGVRVGVDNYQVMAKLNQTLTLMAIGGHP